MTSMSISKKKCKESFLQIQDLNFDFFNLSLNNFYFSSYSSDYIFLKLYKISIYKFIYIELY